MKTDTGYGKLPELSWLAIDKLAIDDRYQRTLEGQRSQRVIERICERFRWNAFAAIQVTKNGPGKYLIIDGQHRVEACRRLLIKQVPCVVTEGLSLEEQAMAFIRANTDRVVVNPFAIHHAKLVVGDEEAKLIASVCQQSGLVIARYQVPTEYMKPGETMALGAVAAVIRRRGEERSVLALKVIGDVYRGVPGSIRAPIVLGIESAVLDGISMALIDAQAAAVHVVLMRISAEELMAKATLHKAHHGGPVWRAVAHVVTDQLRLQKATRTGGAVAAPTREQLMGRR